MQITILNGNPAPSDFDVYLSDLGDRVNCQRTRPDPADIERPVTKILHGLFRVLDKNPRFV